VRSPVVVLDTNVAASGLSGLHRVPRLGFDAASVVCLEAARAGYVALRVSEPLLTELERVLEYLAFARSPRIVRQYMRFYRRNSRIVRTPGTLRVLTRDPDDNAVLECAVVGRADYLVTWNLKDFREADPEAPADAPMRYRGVSIITPVTFVERLALEHGY
jgi:putative PIN family toxin of toxin-antitoxin system